MGLPLFAGMAWFRVVRATWDWRISAPTNVYLDGVVVTTMFSQTVAMTQPDILLAEKKTTHVIRNKTLHMDNILTSKV